ncbi:hypothetical protein U1E44_04680 [Arenibacter sp. GZD96]|uniref:hypothetical protein n=1 Tax=Aurantibrevibacter litoralis TaxID=3106030 RepID=UPI002AFE146E|nr:hypothetical protein [Arenibacter sp. GZD-96]MEA1785378.1 hypothetical protein [Arenibacter sp. GZD-96]
MKRVLVDYKKLSLDVAALLIENYPYGYGDEDIITFKNSQGEIVEAVEIRTTDTIYLVKISKSLSHFIANFDEKLEKELSAKTVEVKKGDIDFDDDSDDPIALLNLEPEMDDDLDYN